MIVVVIFHVLVPGNISDAIFGKALVLGVESNLECLDDISVGRLFWSMVRSNIVSNDVAPFFHLAAQLLPKRDLDSFSHLSLIQLTWSFAVSRFVPSNFFNAVIESMKR